MELSKCVTSGYETAIKPHHNFMMKVAASARAGRSQAPAPRAARRAVALTLRAILAARVP